MSILLLVRNFVPAHEQIISGGWDVAAVARDTYDLEGKVVGTLGAGRIGFRVLQRLKAFDCKDLLYYDYAELPAHAATEVGAKRVEDLKEFLGQLDVLTLNCPLHESTKGIINKETLGWLKPGAWIVNTARGALCVAEDVAEALKSGQIAGYAGDVWAPQPAPKDHPWRSMRGPRGNGNGKLKNIESLVEPARSVADLVGALRTYPPRQRDESRCSGEVRQGNARYPRQVGQEGEPGQGQRDCREWSLRLDGLRPAQVSASLGWAQLVARHDLSTGHNTPPRIPLCTGFTNSSFHRGPIFDSLFCNHLCSFLIAT